MSEELLHEDQSHYEISLTAGQAFVAFVLLLLSLAASFAFGLMIGKGQADERLVVRKEPAVINEGPVKKSEAKLVDLGIGGNDDFKAATPASPPAGPAPAPAPVPASGGVAAAAPAAGTAALPSFYGLSTLSTARRGAARRTARASPTRSRSCGGVVDPIRLQSWPRSVSTATG